MRHTCINNDGGSPNRSCDACDAEEATKPEMELVSFWRDGTLWYGRITAEERAHRAEILRLRAEALNREDYDTSAKYTNEENRLMQLVASRV